MTAPFAGLVNIIARYRCYKCGGVGQPSNPVRLVMLPTDGGHVEVWQHTRPCFDLVSPRGEDNHKPKE